MTRFKRPRRWLGKAYLSTNTDPDRTRNWGYAVLEWKHVSNETHFYSFTVVTTLRRATAGTLATTRKTGKKGGLTTLTTLIPLYIPFLLRSPWGTTTMN